MRADEERRYAHLSPFELKDKLLALAADHARRGAQAMLDAGRGNPNWVATTPREALFVLGEFAVAESFAARSEPELGGMLRADGIAHRLADWLAGRAPSPGVTLLRDGVAHACDNLGCPPDALVHELADAVLGDHYPVPVRMLSHAGRIVHEYLRRELCDGAGGPYDLFAVEGAAAGIGYVLASLVENGLLARGDRIALGVPTFTPYLELPRLADYGFDVVEVAADEADGWQYPDAEIDRLADPAVKLFIVVNPGNPTAVAMRARTRERIARLVASRRPDLMILTDDVYATFSEGFRSLAAELPRNTIGLYSFSKYFGATGWRLGVVLLHRDNIVDAAIAALPAARRAAVDARYAPVALDPRGFRFIDRVAADSRQVALNHVAGLSTPQQAQMALFALYALTDRGARFRSAARAVVRRRLEALYAGMGLPVPQDALSTHYYATVDIAHWLEREHGPDFARFVQARYEPLDVVFRLAEEFATVLLPGGGFDAPQWSVRISLANLPDAVYPQIGANLRAVVEEYVAAWRAARGAPSQG